MISTSLQALLMDIETPEQEHAVAKIYELYTKHMMSIASAILHNHHDAEDALMETYIYICKKPEAFVNYESKETIALINLCTKCRAMDLYRKKNKERLEFVPVDTTEGNWESTFGVQEEFQDIAVTNENAKLLSSAINSLDDRYKIPLILKYFYKQKIHEIAEFCNENENTICTHISRGKTLLQKKLTELGYKR